MSRPEFRPQLLPGLRPVWRDHRTLQFGVDGAVAHGVDLALAEFLTGLDGARGEGEVLADGVAAGLDRARLRRLLAELRAARVVVDGEAAPLHRLGSPDVVQRLEPELVGLALARPDVGPVAALHRRRAATAAVYGLGRVGAQAASLLAAAGVGRIALVDRAPARPADIAPGGIAAADTFTGRAEATVLAVRRAAPEADVGPMRPSDRPAVTVVAGAWPVDMRLRHALHDLGLPHVAAHVQQSAGVVGPFVVPGETSCLTCVDLHRTDLDPAWPALAAQLATPPRRPGRTPAPVALTAFVAAQAVMQALEHLDGAAPATIDATLELRLPGWQVERHTRPPHPRCDCGGYGSAEAAA